MEYQDLVQIWNSSDKEIEEGVNLNKQLIKEVGIGKIKSNLHEIKWTAYFEVVVGFFWNKFLVEFIVRHVAEPEFSIPAIILLLISSFGMFVDGYKLYLYHSLKASDSVVETQKKLASLKYFEIVDIRSLLVLIPLFGAPFLIVVAKAITGLSIYIFWLQLVYFTISSLIIAIILVFLLLRFPNKGLKNAMAFLEELKEVKKG